MVMLAMSRVNFTCPWLAVMSDVLVDVCAVEQERVSAVLTFDHVVAVTRIPDEGVVAGTQSGGVAAAAANDHVIAVAAEQHVVAITAGDPVVAVAAVDGETGPGWRGRCRAVMMSSPPLALTTIFSVVPMSRKNGAGLMRSKRTRVPLGVMRELFGSVAAIDLGGVIAVAALHEVAALARIPDHAVVAGLAEHLVVADPAGQRVVARTSEQQVVATLAQHRVVAGLAEQHIVTGAAGDDVVPVAAEQLCGGQRAVAFIERDRVVAALTEHLDRAGVRDSRLAADDSHGAAIDEKVPGRVTAGNDCVVEAVADHGKQAGAWDKGRSGSHCRGPFERIDGQRKCELRVWNNPFSI